MPVAFEYVERTTLQKSQPKEIQTWLQNVPFQTFISIRPVHDTTLNRLKAIINDFQKATEITFRTPLSILTAYEQIPCLHVHLLVAASRKLDLDWMEKVLQHKAAKALDVKVLPYQPEKAGLSYVLKTCDRPNASWEVSDFMFLFLPAEKNETGHRKMLRKLHQKRLKTWESLGY